MEVIVKIITPDIILTIVFHLSALIGLVIIANIKAPYNKLTKCKITFPKVTTKNIKELKKI